MTDSGQGDGGGADSGSGGPGDSGGGDSSSDSSGGGLGGDAGVGMDGASTDGMDGTGDAGMDGKGENGVAGSDGDGPPGLASDGAEGFGLQTNSYEGPVSLPGPPATASLRSAARGLLSGEMREENVALSGFLGLLSTALSPIGLLSTVTDIARALGLSEEPAGLGPDTQDPGGQGELEADRAAPGSPYSAGPTLNVTANQPATADFLPQGAVLGFGGPYQATAEQLALLSQARTSAGNPSAVDPIPASGEDWVPLALAAAVILAVATEAP